MRGFCDNHYHSLLCLIKHQLKHVDTVSIHRNEKCDVVRYFSDQGRTEENHFRELQQRHWRTGAKDEVQGHQGVQGALQALASPPPDQNPRVRYSHDCRPGVSSSR